MEDEYTKLIKSTIENALDNKLKEFWVDRELHYRHHEFIDKWMKWSEDMSQTMWRSIIKWIILGILGLIALGFFMRVK